MEIVPIILCGGSGTRLWPLSRKNYPKQFVKVVDEHTLFEATLLRIKEANCFAQPIVICNEKHQYLCLEQLNALNIEPLDIIIEPAGRDTAPAITIAALRVQELLGEKATILVLPIDHVFGNHQRYVEIIKAAAQYTEKSLVTFGVTPTYAHTGYGYIRRSKAFGEGVFAIEEFIEKPNEKDATALLASGNVYWNSGTFLFNVTCFLNEMARFHASILEYCALSLSLAKRSQQFLKLDSAAFNQCEKISVDYAILEKTDKAVVAQLDVAFTDIGSWESVYEYGKKDKCDNVSRGSVYTENTKNCLLYTQDTLLVTAGIEDCIVVATKDGILITKQGCSQIVKHMLPKLEQHYPEQFDNQTFVRRPWGSYQVLAVESGYKVKRLTVKPGAKLSLQLHHYRSEHWVVVSGTADIVYGDEERVLEPGKSVFIPANTKHRIANSGTLPLVIIETQMGERVDEDDIVRFEDIYERELV
jgi:mannose-1-phosphate guanylyltransferase/mannose-6-phosphate isomerase